MGNDNAVTFTFDAGPFEKVINKMVDTLDVFKNEALKKMDETSEKSKSSIFGGVLKANLYTEAIKKILSILFSGFTAFYNKFKEFVPEFTKTFSVASDIFFKNLFWPLRQYLLPYLQKLLDWVRDNRKMFIAWGGVLVNVFNGVNLICSSGKRFK